MSEQMKLGWSAALRLLPTNVRIGLVVVPVSSTGYGIYVAARPFEPVDSVVFLAMLVGSLYLLVCILRSYRLVRSGVIVVVESATISRPKDFAVSHLLQVDYSYRYQDTTWHARELLWRLPDSFEAERQYAILDPKRPQRSTLLLLKD